MTQVAGCHSGTATNDEPGGTMGSVRASAVRKSGRSATFVRKLTIAFAALAALSLAASACADDSADDSDGTTTTAAAGNTEDILGTPNPATGTPVKVGLISDGATQAFDNSAELTAMKAAADYWNEFKGGIAGHPIETVTCETKNEPATAADCANKMIADGVVAVVVGQSAQGEAVWKPLSEAKIPLTFLAASGDGPLTDPETTFNLHNGYGTLFALPVSIAEQNDAKKIAFVVIDVPQALTAFDEAAPQVLEAAGLEYDLVKVPIGTADMTPQMQEIENSGAEVVQVVGNDSFCIAAFNGLKAVGYEGEITAVTHCITDATRESVDGSVLDGMYITATAAVGDTEDEGYQLYVATMEKYTDDADVNNSTTMGAWVAMASFLTAIEKLEGEVTPATVAAAGKGMDKSLMPGGGGLEFQCNGEANPSTPAVCTAQVLQAKLDAQGNPAEYSVGEAVTG